MSSGAVLVIDDDELTLEAIKAILTRVGHKIITAAGAEAGLEAFQKSKPDAVLLDLRMPRKDGFTVLGELRKINPEVPVIMISGNGDDDDAMRAIKMGALDYVSKPFTVPDELESAIARALEIRNLKFEVDELKTKLVDSQGPKMAHYTKSKSPAMLSVLNYAEVVASTSREPILIIGETGVGKEVMAKAIHGVSGLKGAFVPVNVAGLDDHMFADTLFGHIKGSYTGADKSREGLLAKATGGTVFLDEIGDLSAISQVKLLRLLQEKLYYQLGADSPKKLDARVVAATNKDLKSLSESSSFRTDLYFRLITHQVTILPLRDRLEDLPLIMEQLLEEAAESMGKNKPPIPPYLLNYLRGYSFPGNIRELKAMVFDAMAQHTHGNLPTQSFLKAIEGGRGEVRTVSSAADPIVLLRDSWGERVPTLKEAEDILVKNALKTASNNKTEAAKILGITRDALHKRLIRAS
jgi:DNA-binding NtrC family response regulator